METHTLDSLNIMTGFSEIDLETLKEVILESPQTKLSNNPLNTRYEDTIVPEHNLVDTVIGEIKDAFHTVTNTHIELNDMWSHIHEENMSTQFHNHHPSEVSAVFYVSCPEGSGSIVFKSDLNRYQPKHVSFKPKPGMFIIFPGFLDHGVSRNLSSDKRISLSFNFSQSK